MPLALTDRTRALFFGGRLLGPLDGKPAPLFAFFPPTYDKKRSLNQTHVAFDSFNDRVHRGAARRDLASLAVFPVFHMVVLFLFFSINIGNP